MPLKQYDLVYLASPYSLYPDGIDAAFWDAIELTATLIMQGVSVYSPIVYTHPMTVFGRFDPLDRDFWRDFDAPMMAKADALAVAKMLGWADSHGIAHEIKEFHLAGKPVWFVDPETLAVTE